MDPTSGQQYLLNCTNWTVSQHQTLNIVRGSTGLVCMLVATVVLAVLLRLYYTTPKPGRSALKRMVLSLTLITVILQAFLAVQFEHYFYYQGQETVCQIIGFFNQWMTSIAYTFGMALTIYLLYLVYVELGRKAPNFSPSVKIGLEVLFYVLVISSTLLYAWEPFADQDYGLDYAFCWIKSMNESCSPIGHTSRTLFFSISIIEGIISVACICIVSVLYCMVCRYKAARKIKTLLNRTLFLMIILVLRIVITALGRIVHAKQQETEYSTFVIAALYVPVVYMIVPLGFLVHVCAFGKIRKKGDRCVTCCCHRGGRTEHVPIEGVTLEAPTNNQSKREYVRSYTYWSLPYTNGFTEISEQEQAHLTESGARYNRASSDGGYYSQVN